MALETRYTIEPGNSNYLNYGTPFTVFEATNSQSHESDVFQNTSVDINYFKDQKNFIKSLNEGDRNILVSYTKYGDRLINGMLRKIWNKSTIFDYITEKKKEEDFNKVFKDIFKKELTKRNCYSEVEKYVSEFQKVFKKVPKLKKSIRVFRGIYTDDFFDPRTHGIQSPTYDFLSTTYDPLDSSINNYAGKDCCIMEFVIQAGVRALWIEPISYFKNEREIIIENNAILYNGCRKIKSLMHYTGNNDENVTSRDIEVFEFEIKPNKSIYNYVTNYLNKTRNVLYKTCFTRRKQNTKNKNK
jgi:hypothetical protein